MERNHTKRVNATKVFLKKYGTGRPHANIIGKVKLPDANGESGYLHKIASFLCLRTQKRNFYISFARLEVTFVLSHVTETSYSFKFIDSLLPRASYFRYL